MIQLTQAVNFDIINNAFPGGSLPVKPSLTVGLIITHAFTYIIVFAGIALLLYLIWGGYKLMLSAGDPAKTKEAHAILTNAAVGFVVIFIAYWLVQAAGLIFGLPDIQRVFR